MTYEELLYSAMCNSMRGLPPEQAVGMDALSIPDTLFPIVSQAVCEAAAANPYKRSLVRVPKSITLASGVATLDSSVLTHYIADPVLIDPANVSKQYAWRDYPDFVRRNVQPIIQKRIGMFTLVGDEIQVIEPNASFADPLTASGARTLTVECIVEKPAAYTDQVDAVPEILSDLDEALANSIRGAIIKEAGATA